MSAQIFQLDPTAMDMGHLTTKNAFASASLDSLAPSVEVTHVPITVIHMVTVLKELATVIKVSKVLDVN